MRDNYHYRFKYFDPKDGQLPDPYAVMFVEVNYRARKILAGFTKEQITESILAINQLVRDKNFIDPLIEDLKNEGIPTPMYGTVLEIIPTSNDLEGIYQNISNVSLSDYIDIPDFGWPQVFASLALYYSERIAQALYDFDNWQLDKIFPEIPKPSKDILERRSHDLLVEANQAITFAQTLVNQAALNKQYHSEKNRKAGKNKFAGTTDPIKKAVLDLYVNKYQSISNRKAADCIFIDLQNSGRLLNNARFNEILFDGVKAMSNDDPCHQFEKWIGHYKKTKLMNS